jgi:hypothetical protein
LVRSPRWLGRKVHKVQLERELKVPKVHRVSKDRREQSDHKVRPGPVPKVPKVRPVSKVRRDHKARLVLARKVPKERPVRLVERVLPVPKVLRVRPERKDHRARRRVWPDLKVLRVLKEPASPDRKVPLVWPERRDPKV